MPKRKSHLTSLKPIFSQLLECPRRRAQPNCVPWSAPIHTISAGVVRLQEWRNEPSRVAMSDQDRRISEIVAEERERLRNFIRRRVRDAEDAEDIVQEVFYELVEAKRLLIPNEHVTDWLFRVVRNRIKDLFRKKDPERYTDVPIKAEAGD